MINISDNQPDDSAIDEEFEILSSALLAQEIKDKETTGKVIRLEREEPSHHPKNDLANALRHHLKEDQEAILEHDDIDSDYEHAGARDFSPFGLDPHRDKLLHYLDDKHIISLTPHIEQEEVPWGGTHYDVVQFYEVSVNAKKFASYYLETIKKAETYIDAYIKQRVSNDKISAKSTDKVQSQKEQERYVSDTTYTISLRLIQRTLILYIHDNKTNIRVKYFKTKSGNNLNACQVLCGRKKRHLTKEELGIKEAKSTVKDLGNTLGLKGPLRELFYVFDTKAQTALLNDTVKINGVELENLVKYCNTHFRPR